MPEFTVTPKFNINDFVFCKTEVKNSSDSSAKPRYTYEPVQIHAIRVTLSENSPWYIYSVRAVSGWVDDIKEENLIALTDLSQKIDAFQARLYQLATKTPGEVQDPHDRDEAKDIRNWNLHYHQRPL